MPSSDLLNETRISLTALARELGVAPSTVWRWTLRGIRGHRLECFSLGGRKFVTRQSFERFLARVNGEAVASGETPRQRERAIERAEQRAKELGV